MKKEKNGVVFDLFLNFSDHLVKGPDLRPVPSTSPSQTSCLIWSSVVLRSYLRVEYAKNASQNQTKLHTSAVLLSQHAFPNMPAS